MILTIPDRLCQIITERAGYTLSVEAIQEAVQKTLEKALELKLDKDHLVFDQEQIFLLRHIFGEFKSSEELLNKIRSLGNLRVQGKEYLLNAGQIKRLRSEAFFHCNPGEPRSEAECKSQELKERIVSRYVLRQIDYYMKQMCSQI